MKALQVFAVLLFAWTGPAWAGWKTDFDYAAVPNCPTCGSTTVFIGISRSTLMMGQSFYEDGKFHNHDPNSTTTEYSCNKGHHWTKSVSGHCWCGWPENVKPEPYVGPLSSSRDSTSILESAFDHDLRLLNPRTFADSLRAVDSLAVWGYNRRQAERLDIQTQVDSLAAAVKRLETALKVLGIK